MATEVSTSLLLLKHSLSGLVWSIDLTLSSVGTDNQAFAASQSDPASVSQVDEMKKSEEEKKNKGERYFRYFSLCSILDGTEE